VPTLTLLLARLLQHWDGVGLAIACSPSLGESPVSPSSSVFLVLAGRPARQDGPSGSGVSKVLLQLPPLCRAEDCCETEERKEQW